MNWRRVSKSHKCLICGRPNPEHTSRACAYTVDVALCFFVEDGSFKAARDGMGWVHRLTDEPVKPSIQRRVPKPERDFSKAVSKSGHEVIELAESLGLDPMALYSLGTGWNGKEFTFPMKNDSGKIVGIRLRSTDGRKYAVKGSRNGLFIPDALIEENETLFVVEGPTDCAAMIGQNMNAIGRPGNTSGLQYLVGWIEKNRWARDIIIIHDRDRRGSDADRLTRMGAGKLADRISSMGRCVRCVPTPAKDAREWINSGATRESFTSLASNFDYIQPNQKEEQQ